ncbi:MAG: glycosyltransferase, partial [Leeuwenhoekiella sp.]
HFASTATSGAYSHDLEELNVTLHKIWLNDSDFDKFAAILDPDIVVFDRFMVEEQFGWRIIEACPHALRILDTEDLHGLRNARAEAHKKKVSFSKDFLINDIAKREIASVYRCDLTLIISEFEMKLLHDFYKVPQSLLVYLPFMVNKLTDADISSWNSFENRTDFMTIGNFRHLPNYDMVLYLKTAIWPLIRKALPEAKLNIYGAYPPEKVKQLHNPKEGFIVQGHVKSSKEVFLKARVCLAALRSGAGLKGKILEAMECGTPCVATSIGAEGMYGDQDNTMPVEDTPEGFAQAAIDLYVNKYEWENVQKNGIEVINSRFEKEKWSRTLTERLDYSSENLKIHRLNNFTGFLLQHQSLQATKYMSKWIEEKNKKQNL